MLVFILLDTILFPLLSLNDPSLDGDFNLILLENCTRLRLRE